MRRVPCNAGNNRSRRFALKSCEQRLLGVGQREDLGRLWSLVRFAARPISAGLGAGALWALFATRRHELRFITGLSTLFLPRHFLAHREQDAAWAIKGSPLLLR